MSDEEGTGIVHIAPGCGKEDFALGKEHGLAVIAPVDDEGVYIDGFGALTGSFVGDDATRDAIFAQLRDKGFCIARSSTRTATRTAGAAAPS